MNPLVKFIYYLFLKTELMPIDACDLLGLTRLFADIPWEYWSDRGYIADCVIKRLLEEVEQ
jgi:hypothetical protein